MTLILLAVIAGLVVVVVSLYNALVRLRNASESAWSDVDVQLKRRYDLIPNLVETVKGYASHEKSTFDQVVKARSQAMQASGPEAKSSAEGGLTATLRSLFALAEAYPELKANQNFLQLQAELSSTENIIGNSRNGYNAAVGAYNEARVVFPSNLVAGIFGFQPLTFFELKDPAAREAPVVKF